VLFLSLILFGQIIFVKCFLTFLLHFILFFLNSFLISFYVLERIRLQMFSSTRNIAEKGDPLLALAEDLEIDSEDRW
jgi:hypothetical protein